MTVPPVCNIATQTLGVMQITGPLDLEWSRNGDVVRIRAVGGDPYNVNLVDQGQIPPAPKSWQDVRLEIESIWFVDSAESTNAAPNPTADARDHIIDTGGAFHAGQVAGVQSCIPLAEADVVDVEDQTTGAITQYLGEYHIFNAGGNEIVWAAFESSGNTFLAINPAGDPNDFVDVGSHTKASLRDWLADRWYIDDVWYTTATGDPDAPAEIPLTGSTFQTQPLVPAGAGETGQLAGTQIVLPPLPPSPLLLLQDAVVASLNEKEWGIPVTAKRAYIPILSKEELDDAGPGVFAVVTPDEISMDNVSRGGNTMTIPLHIAVQAKRDPSDMERADELAKLTEAIAHHFEFSEFSLSLQQNQSDAVWVSSQISAPWDWSRLAFHHAWFGLVRVEYEVRV